MKQNLLGISLEASSVFSSIISGNISDSELNIPQFFITTPVHIEYTFTQILKPLAPLSMIFFHFNSEI